jgi:hypothetical protein
MKVATAWMVVVLLWLAGAVSTFAQSSSPPQTRLVNEFAAFAGSESNAQSLVTGLRQGSTITLIEPPTPRQTPVETTFVPPTRPMGFGNVSHALSLARTDLARNGITDPTTEQVRVALMGGTIVTRSGDTTTRIPMQGVLQMRADGMGWGKIANSMGVKLGHVVSATKHSSTHPSKSPAADAHDIKRVTTAAGSSAQAVSGRVAHARSDGSARSGIVTAAGTSAAGPGTNAKFQHGDSAARGVGVVTAAGAPGNASATGQAHGKGHSKP